MLYNHVTELYFFGFSNDKDEIVQIPSAVNIYHFNIILINSCQTSGFSEVGAIIKYNIMHFPVLIKTVLKLVYVICKNHIIR